MKRAGLVIQLDDELSGHINDLAFDRGQTPEEVVTQLVVNGLKDQELWNRAAKTLGDLTPRELEVARLTAAGFTNQEIAMAMTISAETVKSHLRNIMRKLDLHSREKLMRVLVNVKPGWGAGVPRSAQGRE